MTGDYQRSAIEGTEQERTIKRLIMHEEYDPQVHDNDIALLVLQEPLRFDNYTNFIEILGQNMSVKRKFTAEHDLISSGKND